MRTETSELLWNGTGDPGLREALGALMLRGQPPVILLILDGRVTKGSWVCKGRPVLLVGGGLSLTHGDHEVYRIGSPRDIECVINLTDQVVVWKRKAVSVRVGVNLDVGEDEFPEVFCTHPDLVDVEFKSGCFTSGTVPVQTWAGSDFDTRR